MRQIVFKKYQELALFFAMFIFGMGLATWYVPVIAGYAIIYHNRALSWRMNPLCWINYVFALLFILCTYLPGMGYLTVASPVGTFIVVLFLTGVIVPIFNNISLELSVRLICLFLLGVFVYVASVVAYSLITDPVGYEVGSLVSPFVPDLRYNTAAFSNYLSIVFCGYFYLALISKRLIVRCFSYLVLTLSLVMAISLGGRTFFLVTAMFSILVLLKLNSKKIYLNLLIIILILLAVIFYFYNEYPSFSEVLFLKFDSGMASTRYEHWSYALQQIPTHPFGGFDVNQQIEEIHSFHNILFDAARLGGWFPTLLLLVMLFLNLMVIFIRNADMHVYYLWFFSFIFILDMMQDVILEGTYKFFILFVLLNNLVLKFSMKKNRIAFHKDLVAT